MQNATRQTSAQLFPLENYLSIGFHSHIFGKKIAFSLSVMRTEQKLYNDYILSETERTIQEII